MQQRIENVNSHFTYSLFQNVSRSIFEKDKLLFSTLLCAAIAQAAGTQTAEEWRLLLTGSTGIGISSSAAEKPEKGKLKESGDKEKWDPHSKAQSQNPVSDWLSDRLWNELIKLIESFPSFKGLLESLREKVFRLENFAFYALFIHLLKLYHLSN